MMKRPLAEVWSAPPGSPDLLLVNGEHQPELTMAAGAYDKEETGFTLGP